MPRPILALISLAAAACRADDLALQDCSTFARVPVAVDEPPADVAVPPVADVLASLAVPWTFAGAPAAPLVAGTFTVGDVHVTSAWTLDVPANGPDTCVALGRRVDVEGTLSLAGPDVATAELPARGYLLEDEDGAGWLLTVWTTADPAALGGASWFAGADTPVLDVVVEAHGDGDLAGDASLTLRRVGEGEDGATSDRDVLFEATAAP